MSYQARRRACIEQSEMPYPGVPTRPGPYGAIFTTPFEDRLDRQMARSAEALSRLMWASR